MEVSRLEVGQITLRRRSHYLDSHLKWRTPIKHNAQKPFAYVVLRCRLKADCLAETCIDSLAVYQVVAFDEQDCG
jgi:hypothetical protein